ncbi:conjugal transfer protein TraO [Rugamonas sp. FT103W]|uniref:Conjugal transfer protein TraO n=2 Tax=Rugamonas rivuli TaxID=2743358 RepID=A0A843SEV1_9BURK|nr:conjugal transfer protein TraO [Rugamonas rivuli]
MNGQRIVQSEFDNQWTTTKVGKAGQLQPGIYNLSAAVPASKDKTYDGVVLHCDQEHLYQQVGKICIRHSAHDFSKLPAIGTHAAIRYDANQGTAAQEGVNRGRGVKR